MSARRLPKGLSGYYVDRNGEIRRGKAVRGMQTRETGSTFTVRVTDQLAQRFREARGRAQRLGRECEAVVILRASILAYCMHHEGLASYPPSDPRQLYFNF